MLVWYTLVNFCFSSYSVFSWAIYKALAGEANVGEEGFCFLFMNTRLLLINLFVTYFLVVMIVVMMCACMCVCICTHVYRSQSWWQVSFLITFHLNFFLGKGTQWNVEVTNLATMAGQWDFPIPTPTLHTSTEVSSTCHHTKIFYESSGPSSGILFLGKLFISPAPNINLKDSFKDFPIQILNNLFGCCFNFVKS